MTLADLAESAAALSKGLDAALDKEATARKKANAVTYALPMVTLLAYTRLNVTAMEGAYERAIIAKNGDRMVVDQKATDADTLGEFAGRACYQSFQKPNNATRENRDYIANILRQEHGSVLEHASASFYLTGVSRALTHELIRHRHLSYSQLSQRFVDESGSNIVIPPALISDRPAIDTLGHAQANAQADYESLVEYLQEVRKLPRKKAREAARAVLPNMTETRIVVTGNLRAWRDVLIRRCSEHADAEIREVGLKMLALLRGVAPAAFQDLEVVDGAIQVKAL